MAGRIIRSGNLDSTRDGLVRLSRNSDSCPKIQTSLPLGRAMEAAHSQRRPQD